MTRFQFWTLTLGALGVAALVIPRGWSDDPPQNSTTSGENAFQGKPVPCFGPAEKCDCTCQVYSLCDLGDDPGLGNWVAETIPEVIRPGSWSCKSSSKCRLCYHAGSKMMVVYHCPAVQAEVDAFLKNLRQAMPVTCGMTRPASSMSSMSGSGVVPAQFLAPRTTPPPAPTVTPVPGYPVPAPANRPKHLFHFIIRYEGEGVVDNNVVDMVKGLNANGAATPAVCPTGAPVCAYAPPAMPQLATGSPVAVMTPPGVGMTAVPGALPPPGGAPPPMPTAAPAITPPPYSAPAPAVSEATRPDTTPPKHAAKKKKHSY